MQIAPEQIVQPGITKAEFPQKNPETHEDYAEVLKTFGLKYKRTDYYLEVGEPPWMQGWIIDISVIQIQILSLLETVIPILLREKTAFKIARSSRKASTILGGELGWLLLGKVLSIYPPNEKSAAELARELISLTKGFRGPEIPTDRRLGGVVYTQYGTGKPAIGTDKSDTEVNHVYNKKREKVTNDGLDWPFSTLVSAKTPKRESVLQDRYKPIYMLKEDPKGTVRQGLWLKKIYLIKWCVIKEGRQNMVVDFHGRDIIDRLRWQYELHKKLENILPLPAIYDLFEENGDGYLVMEFVRGVSMQKRIREIHRERAWIDMLLIEKKRLFSYALQVLDIIEVMHIHGYIHRDITSNNFLVNRQNKLWMIDLELSYSLSLHKPFPPFRLGTPGYMSPEQELTMDPTTEQDIYSIGALFIELLTGISPDQFAQGDNLTIKQQLGFFIPDLELVDVVGGCLSIKPSLRPSIAVLRKAITNSQDKQLEKSGVQSKHFSLPSIDTEILKNFINRALDGLIYPALLNENKLWVSKVSGEDGSNPMLVKPAAIHNGFYEGLSGVCWILTKAHNLGFSIESCKESYEKSVKHIEDCEGEARAILQGGLYSGTAGMAVTLGAGIHSGIIANRADTIDKIKNWLQNRLIQGNGIVKGLAGQGMALLWSRPLLHDSFLRPLLQEKIARLIEHQHEDGSWTELTDKNKRPVKMTGFGHGVAGVSSFLLCYLLQYDNNPEIRLSANRAIEWLVNKASKKRGLIGWPVNNIANQYSLDFQDGCMGIILSLVKGYQLFREDRYRELAEGCLRNYPARSIEKDLTQISGLAGRGEVYLEAYKVFGNEEWKERADWIAHFLLHYFKQEKKGSRYWIADGGLHPTADLMVGNSGIIHFLLRYYQPNNLSHVLMSC